MKSILVTGGTGSFGRAFCTRLLGLPKPDRIVVYSRGEHAQYELAQNIVDNDGRMRFFIGDVRDRDRLRRAMDGVDVVVHAAALKRIEVGHYNPVEMVKTNVNGAINIIEAAQDAGVKHVVALSTDKAYQPVSPYGYSKAMAESLFLAANNTCDTTFSVCRYGNVWKSAGSIVPKWKAITEEQERNLNPRIVPTTHPDCTRFFMTMNQAIDLVIKTIRGPGGELNIPELPAYRVGDLAEAMNADMGITGLPEYEKKHEGMCDGNTSDATRRMTVEELRLALD